MNTKISVIGAGSWGTAIAFLLGEKGYKINLWARDEKLCSEIRETRKNNTYLPDILLPETILPSSDISKCLTEADVIIIAVPSKYIGQLLLNTAGLIGKNKIIVCAAKGIDENRLMLMSELFTEMIGKSCPFVYIGGPSFAVETARKIPTAVVAGSTDIHAAALVQEIFSREFFRVYLSKDIIGLQIGGALKNIIAIAAGIADGLNFGHNTRAALITRGLAEMVRLGTAMGADPQTFYGLAGIGDLLLTATGDLSRNRTLGVQLGKGKKPDEIISSMKMVAEGVTTVTAAYKLSSLFDVEMPITKETYLILHQNKNPLDAVKDLLNRKAGKE